MANLSAFGGAQPLYPGGTVELASTSVVDEVFITDSAPSGTANVVPNISVVCDGSPVLVELFSPMAYPDPFSAGSWFSLGLVYDGARTGSGNGHWTYMQNDGTGYDINPLYLSMRMTPTAGVHTFGVNGYRNTGTAKVGGSTSHRGMDAIQFRVSKIVQQNDGLKPFWTPPIVTQLPSNATVGDQVIYAADATNGVYWSLYYDGIGTYPWKYIGGAPLYQFDASTYASATNTAWTYAGSTQITLALPGDYMVTLKSSGAQSDGSGSGWCSHTILSNGSQSDFRGFYQPAQGAASLNGWHGSVASVPITGVSAGTVLRPAYATNSATNTGYMRTFAYTATPIRVDAA
jgi:hypothetical protein